MGEKKRLLKNTGLIAIGNFGAKMISFLLLPLYTSILTTAEYGTYDFIVAVSAFLLPVVSLALYEAMFRFIIDSGRESEEFNIIVSHAFYVILLGVVVLGAALFGINLITPISYWYYIWVYVAANCLYTFANNMLRGLGKMKEYAIISTGKNILQLLLNVLAIAVFRWGLHGLLLSLCVSEILAFLIVFILNRMWGRLSIKYLSRAKLKEMLVYSIPLIPNALCSQIIHLSDRLIIKGVMGASANGIYSISYKFPNIIETVYHYFYTAWSESASRVFAKGKEEATKYYQSLHDMIDNMIYSVILLMVAGMPVLFRVLVRGDYKQGFIYVPILMFAMYFDCMGKFYSGIFTALKKTRIMAVSTVVAAIVNVAINLLMIHRFGLYAAALSTLIADIVLFIIRMVYVGKDIKLSIDYKNVVLKIVAAIAVVVLYNYDDWIRIGVSIAIAAALALFLNKNVIKSVVDKLLKKRQGA
ncbi:MAG: oligosaccharide flippase family protein [Lachnospiraceae bacterium]|nr:oligosaccharide flippase family protein [Lachnospiraceae bacterium]